MLTVRTYKSVIDDVEHNDPHSETIPDQSLSVRDILHRFTRGQMEIPPVEVGDDDDIDSSDSFDDLVDAFDSVVDAADYMSEMQQASAQQVEDGNSRQTSAESESAPSLSEDSVPS